MRSLIDVRGLDVRLPGGSAIVSNIDLCARAGRIMTLLGPSGAGKTTVVRAILHPHELERSGFEIRWKSRDLGAQSAFVPQRGALLDHIDVAANITLAQRAAGLPPDAASWLEAFALDPAWASTPRPVSTLSGGQIQRVAVARALAAGRRILVLDEPSVGLDPLSVSSLARQLVAQARRHEAAVVIITHDLDLAADVSDEIRFLDPSSSTLGLLIDDWRSPTIDEPPDVRIERRRELQAVTRERLERARRVLAPVAVSRSASMGEAFEPVRIAGQALVSAFHPRLARESMTVLRVTMVQAMVRPALFYTVVGLLLGITVPYVMVHISPSLRPSAVLGLIGGTHILALAPPLSAIVFAATSGSAVNAWLGGLRLHGQILALDGLGVPIHRYLLSPAWIALAVSYLATFVVFTLAMTAGGYLLFLHYDVDHALTRLTADFVSPSDARRPYLVRGLWLVVAYSFSVASIAVARGSAPKPTSERVTRAMTAAVMQSTLMVVVLELVTVALLFAWTQVGS